MKRRPNHQQARLSREARPTRGRDPLVSGQVARARQLWREANRADREGWPDVASSYRESARYWLRVARYVKQQRLLAGVYGSTTIAGRVA